jgi:hypothetical protein
MKTPRTIKILGLVSSTIRAVLKDERFLLDARLKQLDDLGGVYIKFLQMVVLQLDAKQQQHFGELLSVYEHSKPEPLNVQAVLEQQNPSLLRRIKTMTVEPFATGSFGQVYQATLDTDEVIIIKILRPNVVKYLRYDLRLLNILTLFYSLLDKQKIINFRTIYREFKKTCHEETDYKREAEVAGHYYRAYQHHPQMVIPKTYGELSSSCVLVQEFISGVSVAHVLEQQAAGTDAKSYVQEYLQSDLDAQLYTVGYELLSRAAMGEIIQADPHPGNILLLPNDRVALIDFGMTTILHDNKLAFYEMLQQYKNFYTDSLVIEDFALAVLKWLSPELYAAIASADQVLESEEHDSLLSKLRQATRMVAMEDNPAVIRSLLDERRIMKVMFFAINRNNRFGFSFDLQSITLLKAAQTYLILAGRFNDQDVISRVITDVVDHTAANLSAITETNALVLKPTEALEILSNWIDRMARNDPWLMDKVTEGYIT